MTSDETWPSPTVSHGERNGDNTLLSRISNEMVKAQKLHFGRGPTQAKSYLLDDFLLVVMRGGMTTAESTMLDFGRGELVRSFRQEFEDELSRRMLDSMQTLTGRTIVSHQSQILFDPYTVVEIFFFAPDAQEGHAGS